MRSPAVMRSKRPNAARKRARPGLDVVEARAENEGERSRSEGVVDVVEPGEGEGHAARPFRGDEVEGRALEARELDRPRSHVERRPGLVAARAAVVAEMADVRGRVVVGRPARAAVLRVGGVGEAVARDRGVVDPEPERLGAAARDVGRGAGRRRSRPSTPRDRGRRPRCASARRCARARRSGRAGRGRGCRDRRPAAGCGRRCRETRPRRPRRARGRPRRRRGAPTPHPRRDSRPRGCARASRGLRRSPRPSRRSSSSRWSPR